LEIGILELDRLMGMKISQLQERKRKTERRGFKAEPGD
jgi:hypothetical protein